jgi:penicillin-binding protein 1A
VGNDDSSPTRGVTGGTLPAYIWRDAMLAAEQGKAYHPLDRSVQPPPEALELASSSSVWDGRDDEMMGRLPNLPPGEAEPPRRERHHRGGLLGWLFGDDDNDEDAPPPRRNDSGRNDSGRDDYGR